MDTPRPPRNLVLSVCEFRLSVGSPAGAAAAADEGGGALGAGAAAAAEKRGGRGRRAAAAAEPAATAAEEAGGTGAGAGAAGGAVTKPPGGRVGSQLLLLAPGALPATSSRSSMMLLLHGGADENKLYDDLHIIELERGIWRELRVGGFAKPPGVYGHSAQTWQERVVFFGGLAKQQQQQQGFPDDALGDSSSSKNASDRGPDDGYPPPIFLGDGAPRWRHNPQPSNHLFILQVDKLLWLQPETEGESPSPRAFHSAALTQDFLVIFGGATDDRLLHVTNDLHLLDLRRLQWHAAPAAAADAGSSSSNEAASKVKIFGVAPCPRVGHAMVTLKQNDRILLYGGNVEDSSLYTLDLNVSRSSPFSNCDEDFNEVTELRLTWATVQTQHTSPRSRAFFNFATVGGNRLFVFGGICSSRLTTYYSSSSSSPSSPSSSSSSSNGGTQKQGEGEWAGSLGPAPPADLYVMHFKNLSWQKPLYEGHLEPRAAAAAVLHDKLLVFGGGRSRTARRRLRPPQQQQEGGVGGGEQEQQQQQKQQQQEQKQQKQQQEVGGSVDGCGTGDAAAAPGEEFVERREEVYLSGKLFFLNVLEIKEGTAEGDCRFKWVTVGDSGVGKTCLLMRFAQDEYSDFHVATIGVDFRSVVTMIRGRVCTLQLWDTAGQERFSGVTGNYYRNADCFLLVFDVTRRSSFLHLDHWLQQIREHHECGSQTLLVLVGNKVDLQKAQVSEWEAKQLADRLGALYVTTSAKTSANVDAAFLSVAARLVEMRRKAAMAAASGAVAAAEQRQQQLLQQANIRLEAVTEEVDGDAGRRGYFGQQQRAGGGRTGRLNSLCAGSCFGGGGEPYAAAAAAGQRTSSNLRCSPSAAAGAASAAGEGRGGEQQMERLSNRSSISSSRSRSSSSTRAAATGQQQFVRELQQGQSSTGAEGTQRRRLQHQQQKQQQISRQQRLWEERQLVEQQEMMERQQQYADRERLLRQRRLIEEQRRIQEKAAEEAWGTRLQDGYT